MNDELDLIKLNIYEAFENGEITYGEKEYLLEKTAVTLSELLLAGAIGAGAIGAGAIALKKRYDASINGLLKKKSKLETKLKNTSDPKKKLVIRKEIELIEAKVKQLEKSSDKK